MHYSNAFLLGSKVERIKFHPPSSPASPPDIFLLLARCSSPLKTFLYRSPDVLSVAFTFVCAGKYLAHKQVSIVQLSISCAYETSKKLLAMFDKDSSASFWQASKFHLPGGDSASGEHTYITSLSSLIEGIPGLAFFLSSLSHSSSGGIK